MTDNHQVRFWAVGHSFVGKIYLLVATGKRPVHIFKSHHDFSFGGDINTDDGWLKVGGSAAAPAFLFRFHSKTEARLHFTVALAANSRRQLGMNSSGYLGLYEQDASLDYWKLQPLSWAKNELRCYLRDHQGHQVKSTHDSGAKFAYLTTGAGTPHEFLIEKAT